MKWVGAWTIWCLLSESGTTYRLGYDQKVDTESQLEALQDIPLPVYLGQDPYSGCMCRENPGEVVSCFGNFCNKFPRRVHISAVNLKVRTTNITKIVVGDLDQLGYLKTLLIEANHYLDYIEPGVFRNLSKLEYLSISFNQNFKYLDVDTFQGLTNLCSINLQANGFHSLGEVTKALSSFYLPSLEKMRLIGNAFHKIEENDFKIMNYTLISELNLELCQIDYIHPKSLIYLKNLRNFYLGENNLDPAVLADALKEMFAAQIKLRLLDLAGIGFRKIPPRNMLNVLANSSVKNLGLSKNQFEYIDASMFPIMKNLEVMDLRKVLAVRISPHAFDSDKFPNLKVLLLSGNYLSGSAEGVLAPQLEILDLSSNSGNRDHSTYFELGDREFLHMNNLLVLNLSYNQIITIYSTTFIGLYNLKILSMKNATIFHIGYGSFKTLPKLEVLDLEGNFFPKNSKISHKQFEGLAMLKILFLNNCEFTDFQDDLNFFTAFPILSHLSLRSNKLTSLPSEIFRPLIHLKVIDLSHNLIQFWPEPIFQPFKLPIQQLNFANNKFNKLPSNLLTDIIYIMNSSESSTINFEGNLVQCDSRSFCNFFKLSLNVNETDINFFFSNAKFTCSSPYKWVDKPVAEYWASLTEQNCTKDAMFMLNTFIWASPLFVIVLVILIVVVFLYKYRSYIRYLLFVSKIALGKRNIIKKVTRKNDRASRTYTYDAFVSYSNDDRDFVINLVDMLENKEPRLKLCVYERDFEIGGFISECVLKCVSSSKHVILVVSDGFAKSQWCRWETQLAEYHRFFFEDSGQYDPLVIIRIGEIKNTNLTPTLKYLLKTKVYLKWKEGDDKEFLLRLRRILMRERTFENR